MDEKEIFIYPSVEAYLKRIDDNDGDLASIKILESMSNKEREQLTMLSNSLSDVITPFQDAGIKLPEDMPLKYIIDTLDLLDFELTKENAKEVFEHIQERILNDNEIDLSTLTDQQKKECL